MSIKLLDYERRARHAVKAFWDNRDAATLKQQHSGKTDRGERSSVTAGKNMNGFVSLLAEIVRANGLKNAEILVDGRLLTLPGFFRPTKVWDLLVLNKGRLVAAIECKSQIGPSFGNNANNRAEEAIGTAKDFWTAYREGSFGQTPKPFVGILFLLEDTARSRAPVRCDRPHFPVFPEFQDASYADRYHLLCKKLVQESLYTSASLVLSSRDSAKNGNYVEYDELTGLKSFISTFAGHVAAEAALTKPSK